MTAPTTALYPWQQDSLAEATRPGVSVFGLCGPRQIGKTYLALERACDVARAGGRVVYVGSSVEETRFHLSRIADEADDVQSYLRSTVQRVTFDTGFITGASIGSSGRGVSADLVVIEQSERLDYRDFCNALFAATPRSGQLWMLGQTPYPDHKSQRAAAAFAHVRRMAIRDPERFGWVEFANARPEEQESRQSTLLDQKRLLPRDVYDREVLNIGVWPSDADLDTWLN